MNENRLSTTKKLTTMAMLSALSVVLVMLIRIPFPPAPFLEFDPADIPILIATFLYGPGAGLGVTVVVSVIQGLTVSASSGIIGIVMHILATGTTVLVAGTIYKHKRTMAGAAIALSVGALVMTAVMVICNLIFIPLFTSAPLEDVIGMLLPIIIPFNLMKAAIHAVVTFLVYKPVGMLVGVDKKAKA